jgi:tRNA threonylcarbamoyladenosine biosynthesis protein TsaE
MPFHSTHLKPTLYEFLPAEADTLALGGDLARVLGPGRVVYLRGELGSGKTTLARGILRGFGFDGRVKSPTFTLVEPYSFSSLDLYHFDFYRFEDPQELADSGFLEYFGDEALCLIEWPEKAAGLPRPDVDILLRPTGTGRTAELRSGTEAGSTCLERLQHARGTVRSM